MTYRVVIREKDGEIEAWAPGVKGCAVRGATETEALERMKEAIRAKASRSGRDLPAVQVRTIEVEWPEEAAAEGRVENSVEQDASRTDEELGGRSLIAGGIGLAIFGITGVLFYSVVERQSFAPLYLVLPMAVIVFGVVAIVLGAVAISGARSQTR